MRAILIGLLAALALGAVASADGPWAPRIDAELNPVQLRTTLACEQLPSLVFECSPIQLFTSANFTGTGSPNPSDWGWERQRRGWMAYRNVEGHADADYFAPPDTYEIDGVRVSFSEHVMFGVPAEVIDGFVKHLWPRFTDSARAIKYIDCPDKSSGGKSYGWMAEHDAYVICATRRDNHGLLSQSYVSSEVLLHEFAHALALANEGRLRHRSSREDHGPQFYAALGEVWLKLLGADLRPWCEHWGFLCDWERPSRIGEEVPTGIVEVDTIVEDVAALCAGAGKYGWSAESEWRLDLGEIAHRYPADALRCAIRDRGS